MHCLGEDTSVISFDGSIVPVRNIIPGDLLMGCYSASCRVYSAEKEHGMLYRVTPVKGIPWIGGGTHSVILAGTNRYMGEAKSMALAYLAETDRHIDKQWKLFRVGINFPDKPVEVDPYLAGLWLGDGHTADVRFTNQDQAIIDYLITIAPQYGAEAIVRETPGQNAKSIRLRMGERGKAGRHTPSLLRRVLLQQFRNGDGAKTIPGLYLMNSREKRLKLLAGLIDTDGYYHSGYYEIATKHEHLAAQIVFLARSLRFASYVVPKLITINGQVKTYYRLTISGEVDAIPCLIAYKQASKRLQVKDVLVTGWSVQPIGEGNFYRITLEGDELLLLSDFTVQ